MTEWYKNYEKGKPFYVISTRWTLQKHYYAGWTQIEHYDKSRSDRILTMCGSEISADMTGVGSNIKPFPEEDLMTTIGKIKESREIALLARTKRAEDALEKARSEFANRDKWRPEEVDFKDRDSYNFHGETYGRFEHEMYKEVYIA